MSKKLVFAGIVLIFAGFLFVFYSYDANAAICHVTFNFDANPKQLNSASDIITLKSTIGQTFNSCGDATLSVEFFAQGRSVAKQSIYISGRQLMREASIQRSASSLGFSSGNVQFVSKVTGVACAPSAGGIGGPGSVPSCEDVNITSSPVNVGIGVAPNAITKYSCQNHTCVQDTNGNYNSYELCHAACVAGTGGGGAGGAGGGTGGGGGGAPTTTQYTFNLPNPIGVENFQDLVNIIGKWIFNLAIPIAVIIIIYAGVLMLTAGGNPTKFKKGADALKYAVLGLAVVLIGKGFVTLVQSILSLRNR